MTITADLQARLAGLNVPVLAPADREVPLRYTSATDAQGRPSADGPRGLDVYLQANPAGYVQVADASGLLSNTLVDTHMLQVEVVAATEQAAALLDVRVRAAIGGTVVRPTPYTVFIPSQFITGPECVRVITTYQVKSVGVTP